MTTLQNAIAQMRANGMPEFPPGHPIVGAGKITRYGPARNAWYVLHEFRSRSGAYVVTGAYGHWGKIEKMKIEVDWTEISTEDRAELQRQQQEAEAKRRAAEELRAHNAANRAQGQWKAAVAVPDDNPYCVKKRVTPEGVRAFTDGTLVVPMWRWDTEREAGRIAGLQKIMSDGVKRFTKNMAKEGAFCRLGPVPAEAQTLIVCEGWATGRSIRMAINESHPVFVAFDAGNLLPVITMLRQRYPGSKIVIAADDDWKTLRPDKVTPWNPGTDFASRAAIANGVEHCFVVVPVFPVATDRGDKWTDFNDLHVEVGNDAVRAQMSAAIAEAEVGGREAVDGVSVVKPTPPAAGAGSVVIQGPWQEGDGPPPADIPLEAYTDEVGAAREKKQRAKRARPGPGKDAPEWMWKIQYGRDGPKASVHNAHLYLTNDPEWSGVLGFDLFAEKVVKLKLPPWPDATLGEWKDLDDHRLLLWLSTRIGEPSNDALSKAVLLAAYKNSFNPVKDWLRGLAWDGKPRLQTWLIDHCHVLRSRRASVMDKTELAALEKYAELIGPRWLVGAVARVMQPGCKMDYMLVIESAGGFGKSSLFRALVGDEWFTDAKIDFHDKDSKMLIQGKLVVEIAELAALARADDATTKQFITQQFDQYRPPYGRRIVTQPRRCVLGGTVNLDVYLKDESGNRRFWPIQAGDGVDLEAFATAAPQLWAEAVAWYDAGERWWATLDEQPLFDAQQQERLETSPWEDLIVEYLNGTGKFAERLTGRVNRCTTTELMSKALGLDASKMTKAAQRDVGTIMHQRLQWFRKRSSSEGRGWYYLRPGDDGLPPAEQETKPLESLGEDDDIPL